ncbi:unnamed protein product [Chironomus riparius]|uniref:Ionotropic glutamate receptor C-terminal domain-containing protein n=1 Tax=Chironomus riparius TaxID=315576 RepID=A0A9N9S7L1_9DIPT|nr:unnamed protein product [Chironomus riparius]
MTNCSGGILEIFEFLLINDQDILYLATVEWFTESACNQPQLVVLNSFNKRTQKWTRKLENYEKFQNFHGCSLTLGIEKDLQEGACWGTLISSNKVNRNVQLKGVAPTIFEILSTKMNFSPSFTVIGINNSMCNVYIPVLRYSPKDIGAVHVTTTFAQAHDIIAASPGAPYTSYEKLWLPFDDTTWKLLLSTFLISFLIIFIINRMPKDIQNVFYGEKIQTPSLNVISTFFGISLNILPYRHTPRIILICFVFFCLVFRTCYQSKLYEFMTSDPRHPSPKSLKDLKDNNFTLYTYFNKTYLEELIMEEMSQWPTVKQISVHEFSRLLDTQHQNASAKIALHVDIGTIQFKDNKPQKYILWHKIPDYSLQVVHAGFVLKPNNFFFEVLDKTVQKLISAGLIDKIIKNCDGRDFEADEEEAQIFSLDNLSFGFVICLGCIGICFIVFILEIIFSKIKYRHASNLDTVPKVVELNEDVEGDIKDLVKILIQTVELSRTKSSDYDN